MIDTFVKAILTRKNGEQSEIVYKRPRKSNYDNLFKICERFHIQAPDWNELNQEFEFDDSFYNGGDENQAPESLELLDNNGWAIETIIEEEE
jgi:hypothetical protein